MIDNFEQLLLLKINVRRLDFTGLTRIFLETDCWHGSLEKIMKGLTPIERIMRIILIDLEDRLSGHFDQTTSPILSVIPQHKVGKFRVDFFVELFCGNGNKYIIECDGHDFHEKTKEQAKYDKQRERFLVQNGYKVLRFSGSEIYKDFENITRELFEIFADEYVRYANE